MKAKEIKEEVKMKAKEIKEEVSVWLKNFRIDFKEYQIGTNLLNIYVSKMFGVVVGFADTKDVEILKSKIIDEFPGFRIIILTNTHKIFEQRDFIIWELMRSGYLHHIRYTYPQQFIRLLDEYNYAGKIIRERLRLWDDQPKFGYLIEEQKQALGIPVRQILSRDPSFFDFMPEKPQLQDGKNVQRKRKIKKRRGF